MVSSIDVVTVTSYLFAHINIDIHIWFETE